MGIFEQWEAGDVTDIEAARVIWGDLSEISDRLKSIEEAKEEKRYQLGCIVARTGTLKLAGLGKASITSPSVTIGYDKKKIESLITDLASSHPDIAAQLLQCRTESVRNGSLRIEKEN